MDKAQIENNVVVNVVVVDPNNIPDWCSDWPTITDGGIGWSWDGSVFTPPSQAELEAAAFEIRAQRDKILATVVDPIVSNPLRWADLTAEQQQAWADYRRALLDVPQQAGFPETINWPTAPNEVTP